MQINDYCHKLASRTRNINMISSPVVAFLVVFLNFSIPSWCWRCGIIAVKPRERVYVIIYDRRYVWCWNITFLLPKYWSSIHFTKKNIFNFEFRKRQTRLYAETTQRGTHVKRNTILGLMKWCSSARPYEIILKDSFYTNAYKPKIDIWGPVFNNVYKLTQHMSAHRPTKKSLHTSETRAVTQPQTNRHHITHASLYHARTPTQIIASFHRSPRSNPICNAFFRAGFYNDQE